jgi:hypothetical protein
MESNKYFCFSSPGKGTYLYQFLLVKNSFHEEKTLHDDINKVVQLKYRAYFVIN